MNAARQPFHYDALKGRPAWSKAMAREAAQRRQIDNDLRKRADREGARRG
jgi:hypothetical protein